MLAAVLIPSCEGATEGGGRTGERKYFNHLGINYAMLMKPKVARSFQDYHCPGDMVVRMRTVMVVSRD